MQRPVPIVLVKNDEYWLPFALHVLSGKFDKYVLYDVGSEDCTRSILESFIHENKKYADIFHRFLPDCPPAVQGAFRNSMFAEARADWLFMVDADEVYHPADIELIRNMGFDLDAAAQEGVLYGVFRRLEYAHDLRNVYSGRRTHHRLYHRTAVFTGTHPGEAPLVEQSRHNEIDFPHITCHHFHNAERTSLGDAATHGRVRRKAQHTYRPGELQPTELLSSLPVLQYSFGFPVAPALSVLRGDL